MVDSQGQSSLKLKAFCTEKGSKVKDINETIQTYKVKYAHLCYLTTIAQELDITIVRFRSSNNTNGCTSSDQMSDVKSANRTGVCFS